MSNPKVFEFAKEIGMTPLALMDKIKEWQLPVKSHMAELEPEVLEQIKLKLKGATTADTKPKKAMTKKAPAKKADAPEIIKPSKSSTKTVKVTPAASVVAAPAPKSSVVRRKVKDLDENTAKIEVESLREPITQPMIELETIQPEIKIEIPVPVVVATPPLPPPTKETVVVPSPVPASVPALTPASSAGVSRKKEVIVGTSGVASASTPMNVGRKNIIGRMDLSRVQTNAPQGGARSAGPGNISSGSPRPGGFSAPARPGARNIRAGFVAQPNLMDIPELEDENQRNRKSVDKKSKKLESVAPSVTPREKELEEIQEFNAVEFRKREMVFQPKKKKGSLSREAKQTQITQRKASKRVVRVFGAMKVADLAQEMGLKSAQLIKALVTNGVMANLNTELDFDTIALIVPEFGWEAQNTQKTAEEVVDETAFGDLQAEKIIRPPVVTIMGHVDHGKTSLLDAIRQANVASGEAGGITQHIGAYSVKLPDGHMITFLDTPGHEAFTAMRARGANATDIAVIVVAADDGMMPQTQEAISHAKAANVPIIVAINKMDKPGANPDRIKQQLTEMELVPEEWGGTTIYVPVSAMKKTGIPELLEQIHLVAEIQELKANPKRSGTGLVIESKLEKGKGPVATLLVKDGTVKVGQSLVAGSVKGRVRSMINDRGERVDEVGPGYPVEVLGLESTPAAGDRFDVVVDETTAERVAGIRRDKALAAQQNTNKLSIEQIFSKATQGDVKELSVILKADVHGSLEAIQGMVGKLSGAEIKLKIIHSAVGGINESDILLAQTSKGIVIGFNVRPDNGAQAKAKQLGIDVRTYSIVYELIDDVKRIMGGMLTPDIVEKVMGRAEVRNTFTVPKIGTIAGCFVVDGKIQRSLQVRLIRDGIIVYEGKIGSLKRFKDDAREVAQGFECGVGIENFNDVKVGDIIEAFQKEEVARTLSSEVQA